MNKDMLILSGIGLVAMIIAGYFEFRQKEITWMTHLLFNKSGEVNSPSTIEMGLRADGVVVWRELDVIKEISK